MSGCLYRSCEADDSQVCFEVVLRMPLQLSFILGFDLGLLAGFEMCSRTNYLRSHSKPNKVITLKSVTFHLLVNLNLSQQILVHLFILLMNLGLFSG